MLKQSLKDLTQPWRVWSEGSCCFPVIFARCRGSGESRLYNECSNAPKNFTNVQNRWTKSWCCRAQTPI